MSEGASRGPESTVAIAAPSLDLVGPTVDDDIRRMIARHGKEAVKDAISRHTKRGRGRPIVPDWPEISDILKADAQSWLEGGDPFASRKNYAIAQGYAEKCPGQSSVSTHRRMMAKLAAHRIYYTLVQATYLSEEHYPHRAHFRALIELTKIEGHGDIWQSRLALAESYVADYTFKFGAPPHELTMKEIEQGARVKLEATPEAFNYLGSLLRARRK